MMNTGLSSRSKNRTDPPTNAASKRGCGRSVMRPAGASARRRHPGDDGVEQAIGGLTPHLGFGAQQQPVPEPLPEEAPPVARCVVVAALACPPALCR